MNVKLLDLQAQYAPLRKEIRQAMDQVCDSQSLILGPHVAKFEKNLAAYCNTKHAIGVTSGTDALLVSLMAIGIKPGDEIICPSFTFFATASGIARLGAKPVFVDIEPDSFNIDPAKLPAVLTKKTKAIIPVHLFGQIAKMEPINDFAAKNGLRVIEDAAQAIGAKRFSKPACSIGHIGCLSFYPTKNLGAFGDAGAVCTNDDALADRIRLLREHGMRPKYHYKEIGGMFRLAAIQAAVLDVKLKYLDQWHQGRRRNAALYDKLLAGSNVRTPSIDEGNYSIYNQYCIRVPNRDTVKEILTAKGIGCEIYYPLPLHMQECFATLGYRPDDFPQSRKASTEVLALPIYPELPKNICDTSSPNFSPPPIPDFSTSDKYCGRRQKSSPDVPRIPHPISALVTDNTTQPQAPAADSISQELHNAQEQLNSVRQQLTETQRLATIGTIAAVIAHEFNNILTPIINYSHYALQSANGPTPDMELIKKLCQNPTRPRPKPAKSATPCSASPVATPRSAPSASKNSSTKSSWFSPEIPKKTASPSASRFQPGLFVDGEEIQLEQVLLNLLINARQAMLGKGGSLWVKAAKSDSNDNLKIQVIDTGPGIPEKLLPKIFQPFFTTKGTTRNGEAKGTGLGLAICKEIIEHHRGRIEVESEVGKGTTFTLHLPVAKEMPNSVAA